MRLARNILHGVSVNVPLFGAAPIDGRIRYRGIYAYRKFSF